MFGVPMNFGIFEYGPSMMHPAVFMNPYSYQWGVGPWVWGPCPSPFNPVNFMF
ncbi:MAG: hypothetical protein HOM11_02600 [Methylococcales bacterium]|jgi:hypothetical protein|nr:hypothetical protein [Methylococcales bacterium]MBT7443962.1 hypothetical protein [Methylococcales bacterium]